MPMFEVDVYMELTETRLVEAPNQREADRLCFRGELTNTEWHAARIDRVKEIKP